MKHKIIFFLFIFTSCFGFEYGWDDFKTEIAPSLTNICGRLWRTNKFLFSSNQGYRDIPDWLQKQDVGAISKYIGLSMGAYFAVPFVISLAKPTLVHYLRRLKEGNIQNKADTQLQKGKPKKVEQEDAEKEESEKQVILYQYKNTPLITSDTVCFGLNYAGITLVQHVMARDNSERLINTGSSLVCGATAEITYNRASGVIKKIITSLGIQNPFDTQAGWYRTVQKWGPVSIKFFIACGYKYGITFLISKIETNRTSNAG